MAGNIWFVYGRLKEYITFFTSVFCGREYISFFIDEDGHGDYDDDDDDHDDDDVGDGDDGDVLLCVGDFSVIVW